MKKIMQLFCFIVLIIPGCKVNDTLEPDIDYLSSSSSSVGVSSSSSLFSSSSSSAGSVAASSSSSSVIAGAVIISNSFSSVLSSPWSFWKDGSAAASGTVSNGEFIAEISNSSADWKVLLACSPVPLISGETYTLTFDARAVSGLTKNLRVIFQNAATSAWYCSKDFILSSTMSSFEFTFTSTNSDPSAKLGFLLGIGATNIAIDNIKLIKITSGSSSSSTSSSASSSAASSSSSSSAGSSIDVLIIGNSYTLRNDLTGMLAVISSNSPKPLYVAKSAFDGFQFFDHTNNSTTLSLLSSRVWEYVVLQNQSQVPGFRPADVSNGSLIDAINLVNKVKVNSPSATIVYYQTWGRENGDTFNSNYYPLVATFEGHTEALRTGYKIYQTSTGGLISPVGDCWLDVVHDTNSRPFPATDLWDSDGSHPLVRGTYLAAVTIFSTITGLSPLTTTYGSSLSPSDAVYLKTAAAVVLGF